MKRIQWLVIAGIFVAIVVALTIVAEKYAEDHYSGRILDLGDVATVSVGEIDLKPYIGGLDLKNVEIFNAMDSTVTGTVSTVSLDGLRLIHYLRTGKLEFRWLGVENADVHISLESSGDSLSVADTASANIDFIVDRLVVRLDKEMNPSISQVQIADVKYRPGRGKYKVDVRTVTSSEGGKVIHLNGFKVIPRYSKYEFGKVIGRRTGRVDAIVPRVDIRGLHLNDLIDTSHVLRIHELSFHGGVLNVFTDKRVPLDPDHYVALPNESLDSLELPVAIDTVLIRGMQVQYRANNKDSGKEGSVNFSEVFGSFYNITTIGQRIESRPSMFVNLRANVFERGELNSHFDFALDREDQRVVWYGSLSHTSLAKIDSFIMPVTNMNLVSGYCHGLSFEFESDLTRSIGKVEFEYSALEVESLQLPRDRQTRLITRMANILILNSNNMRSSHNFKSGYVDYEREVNRDVWHYVWTSVERGIMHTILPNGISNAIEKRQVRMKLGHVGQIED